MAGLGGFFGSGGGSEFQAQRAPIMQAATEAQAREQYKQAQDALAGQQQFVQQVQAQNGLQNQSNVFNQLQGVANGTGPNPAQAMLNNTTGANVANQAAMMAGQRGSSANPALMARQAAMQGANIQQQAAGQGAALQAQQSLGAMNQMGGIAGQQANNQINATNAYTANTQNEQANILNAINQTNANQVSAYNNANTTNAGVAAEIAKQQGQGMGGLMNAAGPALQAGASWLGDGVSGAGSWLGGLFSGGAGGGAVMDGMGDGLGALVADAGPAVALAAEGGKVPGPKSMTARHYHGKAKVPALVSPGEQYIPPQDVKKIEKGADPLSVGQRIPGKPKHPGNDYRNDTVPKTLESGGLVIPNEVMQSKDPHKEAAKFVAAHLAQKGKLKLKKD